jgi:hypothetical protein
MDMHTCCAASCRLSQAWPGALAALLPSLLSLAGCVGEDRDDCPPPGPEFNIALEFSLPDEDGVDRFLDEIHSVDVFILDSAGGFSHRERVERAALEDYQGLRLHLDPGRYRVTCWGNNAANTAYDGLLPGVTTGGIAYSSIVAGAVGDSDPLYRAPRPKTTRAAALTGAELAVDGLLTLEVPATGTGITLPVEFSAAHHVVETRVVGFNGNTAPGVEIAGLPAGDELLSGLSLLDASLATRRVIARKGAVDDGTNGHVTVATFTTFRFALDDPAVVIRVLDGAGNEAHPPIVLADVIDPATPSTAITIYITINFITATVEITVKGWESNEVQRP